MSDTSCIFCRIAARELPAEILGEVVRRGLELELRRLELRAARQLRVNDDLLSVPECKFPKSLDELLRPLANLSFRILS
jgi:hypothetical protein